MRRPLFGNGFPKAVPFQTLPVAANSALQVLDLRSANADLQSRNYLLTLYAYAPAVDEDSTLTLYVQYGSADPIPFASALLAEQDAGQAAAPVKLCDKLVFRGNFRVFASQSTTVDTDVMLFGYYELEAETPVIAESRALQPSNNLATPFNAGPVLIPATDDPTNTTIHLLPNSNIDQITLRYLATTAGGEFPLVPELHLGDESLAMQAVPTDATEEWVTLFDGIPMISVLPLNDQGQPVYQNLVIASGGAIYTGSFKRF